MHSNRFDAKLAAGPQDTERDLASVGDQDLLKHSADPFIR
jgi:hypothetical protein